MVGPPVRLAITVGDPRGIGPEILPLAVLPLLEEDPAAQLVVLGDEESLALAPSTVRTHCVGVFGGSSRSAGLVSLHAIEDGVEMALRGEVDALVTGPIHKPALSEVGVQHPGQTELLQELTGATAVGMLMHAESTRVGGPLRILLATTHHALKEVPSLLTAARIEQQVFLLCKSLQQQWGISAPRIALCALNPHASDSGLFGDEEARVLSPAVEALRSTGVDVSDPLPADTVFLRMVAGLVDAVVAPYHDVGMAVFKTLAFSRGVNVTLGLPFPRTSPDHGTAFDRAGTGTADHTSLLEALRLARWLSSPAQRAAF